MHTRDGNGGKQELKLGLKSLSIIFGMIVTIVAGSFAVDRLVFQTKTEALLEHAEMKRLASEKRASIEKDLALQKQAAGFKEVAVLKALKAQQEASKVLFEQQHTLLYDAGLRDKRRNTLPSKAVYDFDDATLLTP